jgi:hypothetical protein
MSLNENMEKFFKVKKTLERKLVNEGLTKDEKVLLERVKKEIGEAPIDYSEVGGARMEPERQRKFEKGENPYAKYGMSQELIDILGSEGFKKSVEKVKRALGDKSGVVEGNPQQVFMQLMMAAMRDLQTIMSIQSRKKEEIEELAENLVASHFNLDKPPFNKRVRLEATLISGPMGAAEGMRTSAEEPSEEDVIEAFKDAEKHKEELEDFAREVEELGGKFDSKQAEEVFGKKMQQDALKSFEGERGKRRMVNTMIQGAAFSLGHLYKTLNDEVASIDPRLMNLYNVSQAIMEHLYWLYPDMEQMAGSGGGQLGQSSFEEPEDEGGPFVIKAKAPTLPLLVHELVKGLLDFMAWDSLPENEKQAQMVLGAEDTLPGEIWDSLLGPVIWSKFQSMIPSDLFDDDKRHIQLYLFNRFSRLSADEMKKLTDAILRGDNSSQKMINKMIEEIKEYLQNAPQYDDEESEEDDWDSDMSWLDDED